MRSIRGVGEFIAGLRYLSTRWHFKGWERKSQCGGGEMYSEIKKCRLCGSEDVKDVLDLGTQYVVDFVPDVNEQMPKAPLVLARCATCGLVQLRHSVKKELLYTKFWYRSSINEQMRNALRDVVNTAQQVAYVGAEDAVLDIGSNDGLLLGWYPGAVKTVGVDPCASLVEEGLKLNRMDVGIKSYFSREAVEQFGPYKIITAIAMFYDVEDPVQFLKDCKAVLKKDGVLIIQMNYLPAMLENCAVDNIEHEHLTYFSMHTMKTCAEKAGLEVVGAQTNDVNGGSFRVYLTHKDSGLYGISNTKQVELFMASMNLMHKEQKAGMENLDIYAEFGRNVQARCNALKRYLVQEAERGEKIYVYGASTRGTVLMQMLDLPEGVIQGAAERDHLKYGLRMVGGNWVKIYPEDYCRDRATLFFVLPWHFRKAIVEREKGWKDKGGRILFPLPRPEVMSREGTEFISVDVSKKVGVA